MKTKSGSWDIVNGTRYNTEDIVRVFDAYEEWLDRVHGGWKVNRFKDEGIVQILDYTTKVATYTRSVWGPNGFERETVRAYVRGPAPYVKHLRDVGLIKPSRLYDNPVEALSAPTRDGREIVPAEFLDQFIKMAVAPLYLPKDRASGQPTPGAFPDLYIRIEKQRGEKQLNRSGRAEKLEALENERGPLVATAQWVHLHTRTLNDKVAGLQHRFDALGIENKLTAQAMQEFSGHLKALMQLVDHDRQLIEEEKQ